ncbi:MAG: SDR family oxidoreductase [Candidatus Kariarchaeaceae archaeon]|jgi:uncharacterized protein YbjT (DUF2867 family)
MKILVTGATGYLGGHICEFLQNKGYNVTGFIRNPKKTQLLDSLAIPYKIGDVTDQLSLELVMEIVVLGKPFDLSMSKAPEILLKQ